MNTSIFRGITPSIDIQVMEGVFSTEDKRLIIEKVTDAFGEVVGETLRAGTTVRIHEIQSGSWGYGGQPITTEDAKGWRNQG
jgi:4-oxalocrotonate tautomerase